MCRYKITFLTAVKFTTILLLNLTTIFAASAALLVGVGLALQTFIQDIISGVFILADQSVHVGDIIFAVGEISLERGNVFCSFKINLKTGVIAHIVD